MSNQYIEVFLIDQIVTLNLIFYTYFINKINQNYTNRLSKLSANL